MDPQLKQRVVGAAVLAAVMVVLIPIFLDDTGNEYEQSLPLGVDMAPPEDFNSRVVPLDDDIMEHVERAMDSTPEELAEPQYWDKPPAAAPGSNVPPPTAPVPTPRTGVTAWVVQVGSFNSEENAKALVKRLKKAGYPAFIEPLLNEKDLGYRVRIGPELTKDTADKVLDGLAKDVDIKGIVMRYP